MTAPQRITWSRPRACRCWIRCARFRSSDRSQPTCGSLPAYDADIVLDELAGGNLIAVIELPIAANTGIISLTGLFELAAVGKAALFAAVDLASPFVDVGSLIR